MTTDDISILIDEIKGCKKCPLYKLTTNAVPGVGSLEAEVLFVGEAPGEKEDASGIPFVGSAGKFLDELLESIDLKRDDIYITNVVKHRPPGNRDPKPEEVAACKHFLDKQIEIIKPKLIVCVGRHSMARFLPEVGSISANHGRCFVKDGQPYMVIYHPAVGLYNGGMRETLKEDFKKIPIAIRKIKERTNKKDGQ